MIIHVNTIESDVALVAAGSVHRATAGVIISVYVGAIARVGHAVLQAEQIRYVPAFQRKRLHLGFAEGVTQAGVRSIDDCGFSLHFDDFGRGAHFQFHVQRCGSVDQQLDVLLFCFPKPRHLDRDLVDARLQLEKFVISGVSGRHRARETALGIG